jgi:hypothetical protein
MEKSSSFYDWESKFKKKSNHQACSQKRDKKLNSLGIPVDEFRLFLRKWESKNLPKHLKS